MNPAMQVFQTFSSHGQGGDLLIVGGGENTAVNVEPSPVNDGPYQPSDSGSGRTATVFPGLPGPPQRVYGTADNIMNRPDQGQNNLNVRYHEVHRKRKIGVALACIILVAVLFLIPSAALGGFSTTGQTKNHDTSTTFNQEGNITLCIAPNTAESQLTGSELIGTVEQLSDDFSVPFSIMKGSCKPNHTYKLEFGLEEPVLLDQFPTTMFDYQWLNRGTSVNITVMANLSPGVFLNMSLFRYNCYYQEKDKCFTDGQYKSSYNVTADQNFFQIKIQEPDYYFLKIRSGLPDIPVNAIWYYIGYSSFYVQESNHENVCTSNGNSKCEFSIDDRACYFIGPDREPVRHPGIHGYKCTVSSVKRKESSENLQYLIPSVVFGVIGIVAVIVCFVLLVLLCRICRT